MSVKYNVIEKGNPADPARLKNFMQVLLQMAKLHYVI